MLKQFVVLMSMSVCCMHASGDYSQFKKVDEIKARCSKIAVLAQPSGTQFLLKQRNKKDARGMLMPVIETLGGMVAQQAGILSNTIELIPADESFPFKFFPGYPATLHSYVTGTTLKQTDKFQKTTINQSCRSSQDNSCGLTRELVENMALHPDLAVIAALDTFTGNHRHDSNLIYSQQDDRFYSIDYGASFQKNLAAKSINTVRKLLEKKDFSFSNQEIRALEIYRATLAQLIALFPPAVLSQKFDDLLEQSQIKTLIIGKSGEPKRVRLHKNFFSESGEDSVELLALLDELMNNVNKLQNEL